MQRRELRRHPRDPVTSFSPFAPPAPFSALEPRHHVSYYELHNDRTNGIAIPPSHLPPSPLLHTPEELQQPLRQVPSPRSGHLLLACSWRRSLILHGGLGVGPADLLNDTWEYLLDAQRWVELRCRGMPTQVRRRVQGEAPWADDGMPPKAFGQCGALFGGERFLFVHGGITSNEGPGGEFPAFQLDIERRLWSRLRLSAMLPPMWGSVAQTLMVPISAEEVAASNEGMEVCVEREEVPRRRPHSSAAMELSSRSVEVVVVFGGMHESRAFNSTYVLYLAAPPPKEGVSYKEGDRRVVQKLESMPQAIFPGRRRACSVTSKGFFLFIFGGRDSVTFYNDLWVLNGFTRQWIMVRKEIPLRYMRDFFLHPHDPIPGQRIMRLLEEVFLLARLKDASQQPQRSIEHNSSALWRTGAVMVSRGSDIFIHGGFTYAERNLIETHRDMHVYNYMLHTWREVRADTVLHPLPFPPGYFAKPVHSEVDGEANDESVFSTPSLSPAVNAMQWGLVRGIPAAQPDGRTMAAMCADPIAPGFRFFIFGGRSEDEPRGELYDVRIHVFYPALCSLPVTLEKALCRFITEEDESAALGDLSNLHLRLFGGNGQTANSSSSSGSEEMEMHPPRRLRGYRAASAVHVVRSVRQHSSRLALPNASEEHAIMMQCFRAEKAAQLAHMERRKRRLWEQTMDWVRAALLEEPTLRQVADASAALQTKEGEDERGQERRVVVSSEWLEKARKVRMAMLHKIEGKVPSVTMQIVSQAPPFVR